LNIKKKNNKIKKASYNSYEDLSINMENSNSYDYSNMSYNMTDSSSMQSSYDSFDSMSYNITGLNTIPNNYNSFDKMPYNMTNSEILPSSYDNFTNIPYNMTNSESISRIDMNENMNDNMNSYIHIKGTEGIIFLFANIFCVFYYFIPLIWIFHYKHWYIIKQRNFVLTFVGGIANFISTFSNLVTQILDIPCAVSYYCATVATAIMHLCFINRAIRLIFLYKLNIFKVTELSQKKFIQKSQTNTIVEPNIYYKSIYKMVNKRIAYIITMILIFLYTAVSIIFHVLTQKKAENIIKGPICGMAFININDKISSGYQSTKGSGGKYIRQEKNAYEILMGSPSSMFMLPMYIGMIFSVFCLIIVLVFTFTDIKDDQRFGIKFDCFSNAIVDLIDQVIYIIFFIVKQSGYFYINKNSFFTTLFNTTKEGILLFVINGFYLHFTSVIIPLCKCISAERLDKQYENEPTNTIQYFLKILNSPNLVEELKSIAIQEFVVENILFWENYCILQKLVTKAKHKQFNGEFESSGSSDHHGKLLTQDIYSQNSGNSHDEESYDPNYPLLPQLVPYFNAFYHTFIDIDGPAAVNISGSTVRRIYHDFYTYPTVGIFDEAKDEVIESMYLSIFPILLQQNRKQLGEIYTHP
jgi:TRAP-type C4-dicarboxylate transport system permease small subunit